MVSAASLSWMVRENTGPGQGEGRGGSEGQVIGPQVGVRGSAGGLGRADPYEHRREDGDPDRASDLPCRC